MGISSLGVGSSILTQDVLDQLKQVDEDSQIKPIELSIANENDKKNALEVLDASMKNLADSVDEMKRHSLFDERQTDVSGTAVGVIADSNSDVQNFTLSVDTLATKQIVESGTFSSQDDLIANNVGTMELNVNGSNFKIDYNDTTTLKDLKKSINDIAGEKVNATIVQINSGEYSIFLNSVDTGTNQAIELTDSSGNLKDDKLTSGMSTIQKGVDAEFQFNGKSVTRSSNNIKDLVTGLHITLKETGTSVVNVAQNREEIKNRVDSFVEKYNSSIKELGQLTKSSVDSNEKGIFSGESTIKHMKRTIEDMFNNISSDGGKLTDFGFKISSGILSVNETTLNQKLDENPKNVEAFFAGGEYIKEDGTTEELVGAFTELSDIVGSYTNYNATLDKFQSSINESVTLLEKKEADAKERLDSKYAIMKKQFTAYDSLISRYNSTSSMFSQMIDAENAANK